VNPGPIADVVNRNDDPVYQTDVVLNLLAMGAQLAAQGETSTEYVDVEKRFARAVCRRVLLLYGQ